MKVEKEAGKVWMEAGNKAGKIWMEAGKVWMDVGTETGKVWIEFGKVWMRAGKSGWSLGRSGWRLGRSGWRRWMDKGGSMSVWSLVSISHTISPPYKKRFHLLVDTQGRGSPLGHLRLNFTLFS